MVKFITNLGKRGNLFDYVTVGKFMLIAVILGFMVFMILSQFSDGIDQMGNKENYTEFIEGARDITTHSLDWLTLLFLMAALIFSVIMARKVPTEPLFIALALFISFVFFLISFVISNVFGAMMDSSTISDYVLIHMPITKILLQYFPYVTAFYVGIVLLVFFAKNE